MQLTLTTLIENFSIHRFQPQHEIPQAIYQSNIFNITRTSEELSLVCPSEIDIKSEQREDGWSGIKVVGPLDFSLTGILAKISGLLAEQQISIFAISTFDTDYILVKKEKLEVARSTLISAGYIFESKRNKKRLR